MLGNKKGNDMKRILLTALCALLLLSLLSCGASNYSDDVTALAISEKAISSLGARVDYMTADEGYLDDYFKIPGYVTEHTVFFATEGNNIDEFGIFHVSDGNGKDMKELLEDYLERAYEKNREWYDSYIPEETPKLRDAEVKIFGNYAIYAIAYEDDRALFFGIVEDMLKQK